jgi:hypothetical protein
MFILPPTQIGYSVAVENRILVFTFEQVTPETVAAWHALQRPIITTEPTHDTPGLLMLIDMQGRDVMLFCNITQQMKTYARQQRTLMPVRYAWVMPTSPVTTAARQMIRSLSPEVKIDVRFFAPTRRQMAYAWLLAQHAQLCSKVL